jgi:hypothetical protein
VKKAFARIFFWFIRIFGYPAYFMLVIAFLSASAAIGVGTWDFLVWLFNTDWRTTKFTVPIWAVIAGVGFWLTAKILLVLARAIGKWAVALDGELRGRNVFCGSKAFVDPSKTPDKTYYEGEPLSDYEKDRGY